MKIAQFPYNNSPNDEDALLIHVASDNSYQHTKLVDLFADRASESINNLKLVSSDTTITTESLICDTSSNPIAISLNKPDKPISLKIINLGSEDIYLDFLGEKLEGQILIDTVASLTAESKSVELVYVNSEFGWLQFPSVITKTFTGGYSPGMELLLEGSLNDTSGNDNHAVPIGSLSPSIAIGIDGKNVLRWDGSGTQELEIPYFLENTTGATLYCVFTAKNEDNYNLIRTKNLDDYWRFANGTGYIGTFSGSRKAGYPASMPSDGNNLISIHADSNSYEVLLNNQSQGLRANSYNSGDRFRITTNDKQFKGDIALILVYPFFINPSNQIHQGNVASIKNNFPSLSV